MIALMAGKDNRADGDDEKLISLAKRYWREGQLGDCDEGKDVDEERDESPEMRQKTTRINSDEKDLRQKGRWKRKNKIFAGIVLCRLDEFSRAVSSIAWTCNVRPKSGFALHLRLCMSACSLRC